MAKKMSTQSQMPQETAVSEEQVANAHTPEDFARLLFALRGAKTREEAWGLVERKTGRFNARYTVNETATAALPNSSTGRKVFVEGVRLNRPFTAQEIADALPDVKTAKFWTRKLAKLGFFTEVAEG